MPRPDVVERLAERRERERGRRLSTRAERERQCRRPRQFPDQRDIARSCRIELPRQPTVASEVLPTIAGADIPGTGGGPGIALFRIDGCQRDPEGSLLSPQDAPTVV